jgi:hypothetical protein
VGSIPTVVVYGERDALTPPAMIEEQSARWGTAVRCVAIPGVGHDLGSFTAPRALESALRAAVATLSAALTSRRPIRSAGSDRPMG